MRKLVEQKSVLLTFHWQALCHLHFHHGYQESCDGHSKGEEMYDLAKLVCLDYTWMVLDQLASTTLPLEGQCFRRQKGS